jgi:VIT1/CCC1 family predicted Fe2+/Mn2+ transporter
VNSPSRRRHQECWPAIENGIARNMSDGCGRRYWGRMTASCRPRVWFWGVATAHGTRSSVLVAGVAGLVAGAMSMAAGEYVSVHSQADTEKADLARERVELRADDEGEHKELTAIYVGRGLDSSLAKQVADQLMAHDAIGAHARDELGISEALRARPAQAAFASAGSFAVGAVMPLIVSALAPEATLIIFVSGTSLIFLAFLGALAAQVLWRA